MCVYVLPGSFRGLGAFYSKTEIEETTVTQHSDQNNRHISWGSKHKHHIQSLGNNANE